MTQLQDLPGLAVLFVVTALVIGFGTDIVGDVQTTLEDPLSGGADNTTNAAEQVLENWTSGMISLSANAGSLGSIVIAGVIIAIVSAAFLIGKGNGNVKVV